MYFYGEWIKFSVWRKILINKKMITFTIGMLNVA